MNGGSVVRPPPATETRPPLPRLTTGDGFTNSIAHARSGGTGATAIHYKEGGDEEGKEEGLLPGLPRAGAATRRLIRTAGGHGSTLWGRQSPPHRVVSVSQI